MFQLKDLKNRELVWFKLLLEHKFDDDADKMQLIKGTSCLKIRIQVHIIMGIKIIIILINIR